MILSSSFRNAFYAIYVRGDGPEQEVEMVRHRFHWIAFFFAPIWAIYHRLWMPIGLWVAVLFALSATVYMGWLNEIGINVANILLNLWFGISATSWLEERLQADGYLLEDIAYAQDETDAFIKAYERSAA